MEENNFIHEHTTNYNSFTREELLSELQKRDNLIAELRNKGQEYEIYQERGDKSGELRKDETTDPKTYGGILSVSEISRYSRQLIMPELGPRGQKKLSCSSVLIIGCGGLGCPAAIYLAGAGIGKIGLCDSDDVEISNLHRQVLHHESRVGQNKAHSAMRSLHSFNSQISVVPHAVVLDPTNAASIIESYDYVLDCTDNVPTRYLINDVCVMLKKPLISGSALKFEGHIALLNNDGGPCYRCLFPKPPPASMVTNCSDGGVLGVIPGLIGCLQALEAIKLASGIVGDTIPKMTLFDGITCTFRQVRLRSRQNNCLACGDKASLNLQVKDYQRFCGLRADDKGENILILDKDMRIHVNELNSIRSNGKYALIDVRPPTEYEICSLQPSSNIPLDTLKDENNARNLLKELDEVEKIICICRRGNDSQRAVVLLKSLSTSDVIIVDVVGGLTQWAKVIDSKFPIY